MKKILIFIFISLIVLSSVSAYSWSESMQRSGTIQGAYGSVVKVVFSQIATQSSSFSVGMPFDIEGRLVKYSATENGRLISYWSVVSNAKFKLEISAGKLTSVNKDTSDNHTELDYILMFTYNLGYKDTGGVQKTLNGIFSINTETEICTYLTASGDQTDASPVSGFYTVDIMPESEGKSIIGSVEGSVYFMFTSKSTNEIHKTEDNKVLSGDYTADVIVKIYTEA